MEKTPDQLSELARRAINCPPNAVIERKFAIFMQGLPVTERPIGDVETNKVKFIFVSGMIAGAEDVRDYMLRIKRP